MKAINYNIRLVESKGGLKIGFVQRLYKKGNYMMWKSVPDSVKKRIANKIGVQV